MNNDKNNINSKDNKGNNIEKMEKTEFQEFQIKEFQNLTQSIRDFKTGIEKWLEYQARRDEEVKGKEAISRGLVQTRKYLNYYDRNFTIPRATATNPNDYDSSVYANSSTDSSVGISVATVKIYEELERYSDTIYVANDGSDTLFAIISHGGSTNLSKEEPIYPGEVKCFYWVYEMRFRSPIVNLPYRVSEYCLNKINVGTGATTDVNISNVGGTVQTGVDLGTVLDVNLSTRSSAAQFTPIEQANIHNTAVLATTNFLGADLTPTNPPCRFVIQIAMSVAGNFTAIITQGGNAQTVTFNVVPGPALVAGGIYIFDLLVHSGDSINFQYSVGATIQVFRVQEIDAAT